jgi:hypothetical protein
VAQGIFIKKTFGHLSKIRLSALREKREVRKNRETESYQPLLSGLPKWKGKHILTSSGLVTVCVTHTAKD